MVGPGDFEIMSEFLYRTGPTWTPDEKSYCRCAESTCHPDKILHFCAPSSSSRWSSMKVGCGEGRLCFSVSGVLRRYAERLHFDYGFGSVRTCAGIWGSRCRQDAGDGGGCGYLPEPFSRGTAQGSADCGGIGRSTGRAGCPDDGPGSRGESRTGARQQTLRRGGVGAVCKAVGRSVAGVHRGVLRDICSVCC
jgi:hypothetical protein